MTDEQIIKALECCLSSNDLIACWKCPAVKFGICCDGSSKISNGIINKVIDLINRQKAEIERLQQKYELSEAEREANVKGFTESLATEKSKAVKEFAERLKSTMFNEDFLLCEPCDMANIIDNLVKEMTEDEGE